MSFPGGTGSSRQNRYGGFNTRTGAWVGPYPSTEPGANREDDRRKKKEREERKKRKKK